MSSTKLDVLWSPVHLDKFIIWGSDITLYEVSPDAENKLSCIKISSNSWAQVIASQSGTGVRCVDACAEPGLSEPLLALGYASGRVSLTSLGQNVESGGLAGREFVPRHSRLCNSVSWSHTEPNMLAAALDKNRSDHCILLWDVNREPPSTPTGGSQQSGNEQPRPLAEMGLSETAHSITWTHSSARTLLASMNLKYIKIFDLRDLSNKAVSMTTTRYCYGVCADPSNEWQVASRGDNVVCVWDARSLERPLLSLPQPRPVAQIMWCPTRRNLLCSLQRDATFLRLHDVQQAHDAQPNMQLLDNSECNTGAGGASEPEGCGEAHVVSRDVCPGPQPLASFGWHPRHRARLLALPVGSAPAPLDYTVCERVTVDWAAGGQLVWSGGGGGGGGGLSTLPPAFCTALRDVADLMRRRTHTDYGLKSDLWQNADLADDESLSNLWHFLALSKSLVEDGCIRNSPWKHPGVAWVVRCESEGGYRSEAATAVLPDMPQRRVVMYKSASRTRALQLCSWGWGWENAGAGVERAEAEGEWSRAAALAAFHLRLRTALDILSRAPHPQLRIVALALAGLSEERLWRDVAATAMSAFPDPYLRALLAFLAATASSSASTSAATCSSASAAAAAAASHDMRAVLNETEMRLEDRVAFACIFLSDAKLQEYVRQITDTLIEQGDLSGILLTGASPEGVSLLQRWVEQSGDVQSAALVAVRALPAELLRDVRVQHWVDSYRCLLDSWRLWWARCALDTWASAAAAPAPPPPPKHHADAGTRQVCIACGYCGKSVASPGGPPRPRPAFSRVPPPAAKMKQISACPHCRKPLPRCAVCTLHLGTGAAGGAFPAWFTWCVACRHGGHAKHLLNWFREHSECPVSSCSCRCVTLDPPDRG